ncbi:MAG TPA: hydantoinase/oxoprolinase family protein [Clostridiales bacterium]|nr:hydantoinase/oxoprolinase family protein [Clostridiales bacterium]
MKNDTEQDEEKERRYGIGIDSGGTFTDGVIIDLSSGEIIKAVKARTTHHELLIGIRNCLNALQAPREKIAAVSLSTTLATNSVVEGKGADVGTFLIGQKEMGDIPAEEVFYIDGGHDSLGNPLTDLDMKTAQRHIEEVKSRVSAFAVSGMMSVRNPEHELALKDFIEKKYGIPVICGHELTSALGAYERAVTATLNAKLIPVIKELIMAVKETLQKQGIDAPLMLVRGDGSLMMAESALARPIETMLSGPAASIIGARYLTGLQNAVIADMGGTTTDTAMICDGLPRVSENGALVGGFLTRVKAADIHTVGLGGDSHIRMDPKEETLTIGPQRVRPLCVAAEEYPQVLDELHFLIRFNYHSTRFQPTEFLTLTRKGRNDCSVIPKNIHEKLMEGPHSILYLGDRLNFNPAFLPVDTWKEKGLVQICGLTPTDFKVWRGVADVGITEASCLGIQLTCQIYHLDPEKLYGDVLLRMNKLIGGILFEEIMSDRKGFAECRQFLEDEAFDPGRKNYNFSIKLNLPVIAVGAPVQAYYPQVMNTLQSELVIPKNAHVANAIGAITGQVIEQVELLIRPDAKGWVLYTPWEKVPYPTMDLEQGLADLKERATNLAREYALGQAEKNGGHNIEVFTEVEDVRVNSLYSADDRFYLEGRVRARAIGHAYHAYLK